MPTTCATPASINSMIVAIIEEVDCGELPDTGAWTFLPIQEGTSMSLTKNFERSAIINPTRQGGKQIGGTSSTEGTIITPVTLDSGVLMLIQGAIGGTFATGVAKAGASFRTFSVEFRYLTSPPSGYTIERFLGSVINTMAIDLPTTGGGTINFGIIGQKMEINPGASAITDPLPATYPNKVPMAGSADASAAFINAVPLVGLASATINTTNNAEVKYAVGSPFADHVVVGDFDVTADLTIYYRGPEQTTRFVDEERVDITLTLANTVKPTAETLSFRLPEAVYTTADKGNDGPSMTETMAAFGENDAFEGTKLVVTRAPATGLEMGEGEENGGLGRADEGGRGEPEPPRLPTPAPPRPRR